MIVLHCHAGCRSCTSAREALEELAIGFRVADAAPDELAPVLEDEGRRYEGSEAVLEHLDELQRLKEDWYSFQGDACYFEEDDTEARQT